MPGHTRQTLSRNCTISGDSDCQSRQTRRGAKTVSGRSSMCRPNGSTGGLRLGVQAWVRVFCSTAGTTDLQRSSGPWERSNDVSLESGAPKRMEKQMFWSGHIRADAAAKAPDPLVAKHPFSRWASAWRRHSGSPLISALSGASEPRCQFSRGKRSFPGLHADFRVVDQKRGWRCSTVSLIQGEQITSLEGGSEARL